MNSWEEINAKLDNSIKKIFPNHEFNMMNDFEKREYIFDYLINNLTYDFELLKEIAEGEKTKIKPARDLGKELRDVMDYNKGICNAISQYYKLLLEKVGVRSYCVICDDGTDVKHQLNLVYDKEEDAYSFDDITSVIVKRGKKEDFFDYSKEDAHNLNQGNKLLFNHEKFFILSEEYISYVVGRKENVFESIEYKEDSIKFKEKSIPVQSRR